MVTAAPPPPGPRDPFSHVDRDGNPKQSFPTEHEATILVAKLEGDTGSRFTWYVCGQKPEHWHVARIRQVTKP